MNKVVVLFELDTEKWMRTFIQNRRVYSTEGISPALTAEMGKSVSIPKVLVTR